jgi:hypothetical protein
LVHRHDAFWHRRAIAEPPTLAEEKCDHPGWNSYAMAIVASPMVLAILAAICLLPQPITNF